MTDRICCVVPHCRRTLKNTKGFAEWICPKHWAMVPKAIKDRRRRARYLAKRASDRWIMQDRPAGRPAARVAAAWRLDLKQWDRCKAAAIEAAGGI